MRENYEYFFIVPRTFVQDYKNLRYAYEYPCYGQMTAVKIGCPLTSIIWPYGGLRA